jgi:metacaspase-1
MAKKAFCVGINDYPYEGSDLNGCVNDANAWADLLIKHYDFPSTEVKIILDEKATKRNIISGVKNLLEGAESGDILVFTNSSHGTYIADTSGDEPMYDEALCPYDSRDNLLVDDELRELFEDLPRGVHLTVISDSCFSGTVLRVDVGENLPGMLKLPDDRRVRFLSPALRGDPVLENPFQAKPKSKVKYPESGMKALLLSGSSDKEYSYDALIGDIYHGAMTYYALQAIRAAKYKITYNQLIKRLGNLIEEGGYPQHPQLEGKAANKKRMAFT